MSAEGSGVPHPAGPIVGLTTLFGVFYFVQGICEPTDGLLAQPVQAMLKSWKWDANQISTFMAALALPWSIKPLYGLLSDFVPIAGYRRKIYLIAASALVFGCLAAIAAWWPSAAEARWLFWLMLGSSFGVAMTDVVIDALMVETAQPRGLTGRFQSVQWGSVYAAGILTATLGGYLSEHQLQRSGFAIAGGLALATAVLAVFAVHEARRRTSAEHRRAHAAQALRAAVRTPGLLAVGAFLFLWTFNPFSSTVRYVHMTTVLNFREQFFGNTDALSAAAQMFASLGYGFYCRRLKTTLLIHLSIVLGVVSTLAYWALDGHQSALIISVAVGVTSATAVMIQLDLAARICPPRAAGTVFALLMGLSNLGTALSTSLGGYWYERWSKDLGSRGAFDLLVGVGALFTAGCWLLVPALKRAIARSAAGADSSERNRAPL